MTLEQKELLLKDLCARLPYGVKVEHAKCACEVLSIDAYNEELTIWKCPGYYPDVKLEDAKPYLFPLSSMTEEQKYDFYSRFIENDCDFNDFKEFYLDGGMWHKMITSLDDVDSIIDWFHKNHFDYRGLIPTGLANNAVGKNIY